MVTPKQVQMDNLIQVEWTKRKLPTLHWYVTVWWFDKE